MHEICNIMGITKTRTTAYIALTGDGQVERQNRTLSNYVSNRADDWDLWLDPVLFAYNTSKHESTGFAQYELVFGKLPRMPLELEFGVTVGNLSIQPEYAQSIRKALQTVRQVAKENLAKVRSARCLKHGNETWKPHDVGQTVWVKRPKTGKFGRNWIGPYKVVNRLGITYRVQSKDGKVMIVYHDNIRWIVAELCLLGVKQVISRLLTACLKTQSYHHLHIDLDGYTRNAVHFGKTYVLQYALLTIRKLINRYIRFCTIFLTNFK